MRSEDHKHLKRLERVWLNAPVYFVTVCTFDRQPILTRPAIADILVEEWRQADGRHGWLVGRHVTMPDHVHFFCAGRPDARTLSQFLGAWKEWTSKRIRREVVAAGIDRGFVRTASAGQPPSTRAATTGIWQREFFDHVLRSDENYAQKWEYVRQNPVRAGLVARAEDWPFQGEIHLL